MPNWVYGHYAIKGPKKNVLAFLNEGVKNSGEKPKKSCKSAYEFLTAHAKTKESNVAGTGKQNGGNLTDVAVINYVDKLSLDTFRPMPDTFKLYDTTNCAEKMPEIAKEQMNLYGCIGWYDWGLKYRGTKWNAVLEEVSFDENDDTATFKFDATTAWSYPEEWLRWVKSTFHVSVLLCVDEEGGAYCFYAELDGEKHDLEEKPGKPNEGDFENDDAYWDALYDWESECKDAMLGEFNDYVVNW